MVSGMASLFIEYRQLLFKECLCLILYLIKNFCFAGHHQYRTTGIKSKEGERCGERIGPFCDSGLACIGKIQLVDGLGTCRRIGILNNLNSLFL